MEDTSGADSDSGSGCTSLRLQALFFFLALLRDDLLTTRVKCSQPGEEKNVSFP